METVCSSTIFGRRKFWPLRFLLFYLTVCNPLLFSLVGQDSKTKRFARSPYVLKVGPAAQSPSLYSTTEETKFFNLASKVSATTSRHIDLQEDCEISPSSRRDTLNKSRMDRITH